MTSQGGVTGMMIRIRGNLRPNGLMLAMFRLGNYIVTVGIIIIVIIIIVVIIIVIIVIVIVVIITHRNRGLPKPRIA